MTTARYPARGRWRRRKRVVRQLASELGWPGCMAVASSHQIEGAVIQAGVRLRDFYKLGHIRLHPAKSKSGRDERRRTKREARKLLASGGIPF